MKCTLRARCVVGTVAALGLLSGGSAHDPVTPTRCIGAAAVSLVTPAIYENVQRGLPEYAKALHRQTCMPAEVVVVVSGVDSPVSCQRARGLFTGLGSVRVSCIGELLSAAGARNVGVSLARHRIISFLDADDSMALNRIEYIAAKFAMNPGLRLFCHGYTQCRATADGPMSGGGLHHTMVESRHEWIHADLMHSSCSVVASMARQHPFDITRPGAEDSLFVRSVLRALGPVDSFAEFDPVPLLSYTPSAVQKAAGRPLAVPGACARGGGATSGAWPRLPSVRSDMNSMCAFGGFLALCALCSLRTGVFGLTSIHL